MSALIGNIQFYAFLQATITLTTGTVPSWVTVGGQVSGPGIEAYTITSINGPRTSMQVTLLSGGELNHFNARMTIAQAAQQAQLDLWWQIVGGPVGGGAPKVPQTNSESSSPGYFGSDGSGSIDLAPAGISGALWMTDDSIWVTAAHATRAGPGGGPHNTLCYQTGGYDLTLTTNQFAITGAPSAGGFFIDNLDGLGTWYYPFCGIAVSSTCVIIMGIPYNAPHYGPGARAYWGNPSLSGGILNSSSWQIIPTPFGDGWPVPTPGFRYNITNWTNAQTYGYWDSRANDGFIYAQAELGMGTLGNLGTGYGGAGQYMLRYPIADLQLSPPSLMKPQWWCGPGLGWIAESPTAGNPPLLQKLTPVNHKLVWAEGSGDFYQKSDLSWVRVSTLANPTGGPIQAWSPTSALTNTYNEADAFPVFYPAPQGGTNGYPPSSNATALGPPISYFARAHPEQTWVGKGTDDIMLSYSTNSGPGLPGNILTYWPYLIQVAGL